MATDVGNLNGVVKSTESQYEEMMTTGQSYSDTKIYLIAILSESRKYICTHKKIEDTK